MKSGWKSSWRQVLGVGCALLLAGCTAGSMSWNARVGKMTYAQAVQELGRPARERKLPDGDRVAEWISRYTYGAYDPAMDDIFIHSPAVMSSTLRERQLQTSRLRLTFDTNNILTSWSKD